MRFVAGLLIAAAVGASAHHDGPHLFQAADPAGPTPRDHHGGRGKWACNLIAFQNSDVSVDECMTIHDAVVAQCQESIAEEVEDRRHAVFTCVRDVMKEKFNFVSLREMPAEQRALYIKQECSYKNEDGTAMHGDVAECEARFTEIVDQCIAEANEDSRGFHQCMRRAFQNIHHGDHHDTDSDSTSTDDHSPPGEHADHHGRPGEQWRGGGGRGHGRGRRGRAGRGKKEPIPIDQDGEVHIFPGEDKPVDEQPPMEKPLFPIFDNGGVSILPGEEGPEEPMPMPEDGEVHIFPGEDKPVDGPRPPMEKPLFPRRDDDGVSILPGEEGPEEQMPPAEPKHPHHGWKRRQHATGEAKSPLRRRMEKMMSMRSENEAARNMVEEPAAKPLSVRPSDRSHFRGGRERNFDFKRRLPRW